MHREKLTLPSAEEALPGREVPVPVPARHEVLGTPLAGPYPAGFEVATFAMGCFWGAERLFWEAPGVYSTAAGYAGGGTPNPTYEEVCSGRTGHAEVVRVVFDPAATSYGAVLRLFLEGHDPTQWMRQGGDIGTQYRSAIFVQGERQRGPAEAALAAYQEALTERGFGPVTTEVVALADDDFYFAEEHHQQYLAKNPDGYCGLGGTGVRCDGP